MDDGPTHMNTDTKTSTRRTGTCMQMRHIYTHKACPVLRAKATYVQTHIITQAGKKKKTSVEMTAHSGDTSRGWNK